MFRRGNRWHVEDTLVKELKATTTALRNTRGALLQMSDTIASLSIQAAAKKAAIRHLDTAQSALTAAALELEIEAQEQGSVN